jgi:hypothetical protein
MTLTASKIRRPANLALMLLAIVFLAQPGLSLRRPVQSAQSATPNPMSLLPPAGFTLQELMILPVDGSVVQSQTALRQGVIYKLRASGTAVSGGPGFADAEYSFDINNGSLINNCGNSSLGVDLGIGVNDTLNTNNKFPFWGTFDATHTYTINFVGQGSPITLKYHDCAYGDNSGLLTVAILAPTFDLCLQDDSSGDTLLISSTTGEFVLCCAAIETGLSGFGTIKKKGCVFTFQHNTLRYRLTASVDTCQRKGSASVQLTSSGIMCTIVDRDTANNTCTCVGPTA